MTAAFVGQRDSNSVSLISRSTFAVCQRLLAVAVSFIAFSVFGDDLNMRVGVTAISESIYNLHMQIFIVCVVIGIGVFSAMFYSMFKHRKSRGYQPATFHESTRLEIAWTVVPLLILIVMSVPATQVLIEMYDTGGEDMTVEVRGYQWKWQYKYLDDDYNSSFSFFSLMNTPRDEIEGRATKNENYLLEVDRPLRIPTGRKVRFLVTSEDVIHAWWVPDFGIKRDAVPGIINELWTVVDTPGTYRGQCAELCGKDHGFMPVVVEALPPDEFDSWYRDQVAQALQREADLSKTFTEDELMARGEEVYGKYCASCHQMNGQGVPPVFPSLVDSPIVTGPRVEHIRMVYEGVLGTAMQAFSKQLDAADLAAVVHYERHAWGNNAGDVTQPRDVVEFASGEAGE